MTDTATDTQITQEIVTDATELVKNRENYTNFFFWS